MLLQRLQLLLVAASAVKAFKNTSPFFLLSSQPLDRDATLSSATLTKHDDLEDQLIESLSACDKKWYYIFKQEHVGAADLRSGAMPQTAESIGKAADKGTVVEVPNVVGVMDEVRIRERLTEWCERVEKKATEAWPEADNEYRVITMPLPALPADANSKAGVLKDTDAALAPTVQTVLDAGQSAVLIYITTPPTHKTQDQGDGHHYEMDDPYPSSMHTDLKRDVFPRQDSSDGEMQAGLPLFEKYQFLTPGLFMGLGVAILLLSILYVGISAIANLEVSYMAFSKEMGPQAQKKQQQ